ncbi:MAG: hypothetical protein NTX88_00575 [Candidatus Atribacteria bacterium]|nr:hypothetical protein [Candidatus Atribacteria bacterium]
MTTALELLGILKANDIDVHLVGDDLRVEGEPGALTPELVAALRKHKRELVSYFSTRSGPAGLSAEWRLVSRWAWTGIKLEAERVGDEKRAAFAREVLDTIPY